MKMIRIFYQLIDCKCRNNLLTIEQFGFRTGHSIKLATIQFVDHLTKQMDMGKVPTNIYIDLSKALDHSILLDKLTYYGVCGLENTFICYYVTIYQVLKHVFPREVLLTLYNALILSH